MEKLTIADYLCSALKKLDPPTDWEDILEYVLATLNCPRRHKYYTKELTKALEVGLRFGIIRVMNNKYYLYEYAKINLCGEITYEFTPNPLSPQPLIKEEADDDEDESTDEDVEGEDDEEDVKSEDDEKDVEEEDSEEKIKRRKVKRTLKK